MNCRISESFRRNGLALALLAASALAMPVGFAAPMTGIVALTQVPCQFLESDNGV